MATNTKKTTGRNSGASKSKKILKAPQRAGKYICQGKAGEK